MKPAATRLLWFVLLWCAGVGLVLLLSLGIKTALGA